MFSKALRTTLVSISVCTVPFAASAQSPDCSALEKQLTAALLAAKDSRDYTAVLKLENNYEDDCGSGVTEFRRRRAEDQTQLATALEKDAKAQQKREVLLMQADAPQVWWSASYRLGKLRAGQKRYVEAAEAFDRAIMIAADTGKTPNTAAPNKQKTEELMQLAANYKSLAADSSVSRQVTFVRGARNYRGEISGSLSKNVRGVTILKNPLPIKFETDSYELTQVGRQAADEFVEYLKQQNVQQVMITGHTDERGDDGYNMQLSQNRVAAVENYLKQAGFPGQITAQPKGKREPVEIPNANELNQEEVWALNRRVEWRTQ